MDLSKTEAFIMMPGQKYTVISPADNIKLTEEEVLGFIGSENLNGIIYIAAKASYIDAEFETLLVWDDVSKGGRNTIANQVREENIGDCVDKIYGNAILCHIDLLPDSLTVEQVE